MGLHVENPSRISEFMEQAEKLCKVRIIDYNSSGRAYDNSIFYSAFVRGLSQMLTLSDAQQQGLLVSSNLAMQTLDEQGQSPYRTFDSISKFAELLAKSKGAHFAAAGRRQLENFRCSRCAEGLLCKIKIEVNYVF